MLIQRKSGWKGALAAIVIICVGAACVVGFVGFTREMGRLFAYLTGAPIRFEALGQLLGRTPSAYTGQYRWPLSIDWGWAAMLVPLFAFGVVSDFDQPALPARPIPTPTPAPSAIKQERKPMTLPRWLWPRFRGLETTAALRLGRVIHWSCVIVAVLIAALGVVLFFSAVGRSDAFGIMVACMAVAMVAALFGRAVLYVLGSE